MKKFLLLISTLFLGFLFSVKGDVLASFTNATDIPVTSDGFTATGQTVSFSLNCTLEAGTDLMVVKNTSLNFINGAFSNLAQGQTVTLEFEGFTYEFVAHYYGGTGNDLVLRWKMQTLLSWGSNMYEQLGYFTYDQGSPFPNSLPDMGAITGKTIVSTCNASIDSLALCSDGTVAVWGGLYDALPTAVNNGSGSALYRKSVAAIHAGSMHHLALCSDGTIAGWGSNQYGQLGTGQTLGGSNPRAVSKVSGVSELYNKTPVALSGGREFSMALCSDGNVATWGRNDMGQLGDGTLTNRLAPVAVNTTSGVSALHGKSVIAISAGYYHALALCSDGTLASWGDNDYGQLGDNTTADRNVPVTVNAENGVSALYGRNIIAISAGGYYSTALCSDGAVVSWGNNSQGQLGDNTTIERHVPVQVSTENGVSALHGRTVKAIYSSSFHTIVTCTDGRWVSWGNNFEGSLGDGTMVNRKAPVMVNISAFEEWDRCTFASRGASGGHTLGIVARMPFPKLGVYDGSGAATSNQRENDTAYAFPDTISAVSSNTAVFTIQNNGRSRMSGLEVHKTNTGTPEAFDISTLNFTSLEPGEKTVFTVNFHPSVSGNHSAAVEITTANSNISPFIIQLHGNGIGQSIEGNYITGKEIPLSVSTLTGTGYTVELTLNYAPVAGTELMVVKNTGLNLLNGNFNLAQGEVITLNHAGVSYPFVVNYYGGDGNDLVLVWKNNRLLAWGDNAYGSLGTGAPGQQNIPVAVNSTGILSGKTIIAMSSDLGHSLALCSDGTLAAWGENTRGQLGYYSENGQSKLPGAVDTTSGVSVLHSKTIVAIAAGVSHSVALCSDGTVATWGANDAGQLGDNSTTTRYFPVAVNTTSGVSALYGKTVVAISAGSSHTMALCSDGSLVGWGANYDGQLGDNTTTMRSVPVAVNTSIGVSALYNKRVVAVSGGESHTVVKCADGSLIAWGRNFDGQLGDNTTTRRLVPVAVSAGENSALYGKLVAAISAGQAHTLALCSDGSVAAWGKNSEGQLGTGDNTQRNIPTATKTIFSGIYERSISAGYAHSLVLFNTGYSVSYGWNMFGQLGRNGTNNRSNPGFVDTSMLAVGERFIRVEGGGAFSVGLVAYKVPEIAVFDGTTTLPASEIQSNAGNITFPNTVNGATSPTQTITIQNKGSAILNTLVVTKAVTGNPMDFTVSAPGAITLASGASTTFTVSFSPSASGTRTAIIQIASNDTDENPFLIPVSGIGITRTPLAGTDSMGTTEGVSVNATISKLLANDTDPDGDSLNISAVSGASLQGGLVALNTGIVTYTPSPNFLGSDSFTYTLADGHGGTATGTVNVTVSGANSLSQNSPSITQTSEGFQMKFYGIPGEMYRLEYTDTFPTGWTPLAPVVAQATGLMEYEDKPEPVPTSRIYRILYWP